MLSRSISFDSILFEASRVILNFGSLCSALSSFDVDGLISGASGGGDSSTDSSASAVGGGCGGCGVGDTRHVFV